MRHLSPTKTQFDSQGWPIKISHLVNIAATFQKNQSKHGKIILSAYSVEMQQLYQYTYGSNTFPRQRNNCYCWGNHKETQKYQPIHTYMASTTTMRYHFYLLKYKLYSTRNRHIAKIRRKMQKGIRTRHILWTLPMLEPMGKWYTRTKSFWDSIFQTQIHHKPNHHSRRGFHCSSRKPSTRTQNQNSTQPKRILHTRIIATA